ncbi:MAG: DUF465 domain-containing protein [Proteobacteria bacterium]|nr:DUF465 domain-containing protein [Pseudomonadota bacterium]
MNLEEIEVESALVRMKQEHRDLDDAIVALGVTGTFDQLQVQRMKKRKLVLRDEISQFETRLLPDIIA